MRRLDRDPTRPVYVISVAASIVSVHPRTLRIYEDEGLLCPARTATNIRLYSEEDVRRILWIRHLTQNRGVNLAGIRILFELEERLGTRILETLFDEANAIDDEQARQASKAEAARPQAARPEAPATAATPPPATEPETNAAAPRASRASTSNEPSQQTPNRTRQVVGADHH
ncbi:MAG TPA: MerR family transcriptional regulator [Candidatus Limnocylindrales bacterium]